MFICYLWKWSTRKRKMAVGRVSTIMYQNTCWKHFYVQKNGLNQLCAFFHLKSITKPGFARHVPMKEEYCHPLKLQKYFSHLFFSRPVKYIWVCIGPKQREALYLAFSRDLWLMGNVGWATASFNPASVVSLGCELVLQLVKGSSGTQMHCSLGSMWTAFWEGSAVSWIMVSSPFCASCWRCMQDAWMLFSSDRLEWVS